MTKGKCRLCLQDTVLVSSHLMPRALYDLCQIPGVDPVRITPEVVLPTTRQTKDYVLCTNCEQTLNRNGENWILPKLATPTKEFPLFEILSKVTPIPIEPDVTAYAAGYIQEIDVNSMMHFAAGLFWKASVHPWKGSSKDPLIQLGPYSEQLRMFLLGQTPFPPNVALLISVLRPSAAISGFFEPNEGKGTMPRETFPATCQGLIRSNSW